MNKTKIVWPFTKYQNKQKNGNATINSNPNDDFLRKVKANTADLEVALWESEELLALTNDLKTQAICLAVKIGIEIAK